MARSRRPALRGQVDLAIRILQRWAGEVKDAASKENDDVQQLRGHVQVNFQMFMCRKAQSLTFHAHISEITIPLLDWIINIFESLEIDLTDVS